MEGWDIGKYKGEGENNKIDAHVVIACTVDLGWESNKKKTQTNSVGMVRG